MDDFTVRKDVTTQDTSDEDNPSDDSVATATVPSRDMNLAEQARYRDWLHKASKVLGRGDLSERTVLASLALLATRMKIWPPGEDAPWFELLASCADSLVGAPTDVRDEAALITTCPAPVRALGQVALYELAQGARLQGTAAAIATYERLEDRLRPLLTPTDPAMVARRVKDLQVPWALPGEE